MSVSVRVAMKSISPITHEEIASRAYTIWDQNGRPEGLDTECWFRAERELHEEREHAEGQTIGVGESVSVLAAAKNGGNRNRRAQASSRASAG